MWNIATTLVSAVTLFGGSGQDAAGLARMEHARAEGARIDGETFERKLDGERLSGQLARVLAVMRDGEWRTLDELSELTDSPPASVSARLRDLRKPRFGRFDVQRQRRGDPASGLFEYRLRRPGTP